MSSSFPTQKSQEIFFLLIYFGVWLMFYSPAGCLPDLSPPENRVYPCSSQSYTQNQAGGCCIRGHRARVESLNLLVSSGPVSTRACQMSLGAAGNGEQSSPEICTPVLSPLLMPLRGQRCQKSWGTKPAPSCCNFTPAFHGIPMPGHFCSLP